MFSPQLAAGQKSPSRLSVAGVSIRMMNETDTVAIGCATAEVAMMTKLAFVEDHDFIRRSMIENIDWAEIGIEICGEYSNGKLAIEGFKNFMPDIVISDIRMPDMDGLEMLEHIFVNKWEIETIILSAFDDFKYAQKALLYNAANFLLKPCRAEDLKNSVAKIKNKIEEKRKKQNAEAFLNNGDSLMKLKKIYLKTVLDSESTRDDPIDALPVNVSEGPVHVIVIQADILPEGAPDIRDIYDIVTNIPLSILSSMEIFIHHNRIVCIMGERFYRNGEMLYFIHKVVQSVNEQLGVKPVVGIGPSVDGISCCAHSYHKALYAINMHFFNEEYYISFYSEKQDFVAEPCEIALPYVNMAALMDFARKNDTESMNEMFDTILRASPAFKTNRGLMNSLFSFLIFLLNNMCVANGKASYETLRNHAAALRQLSQTTKISDCTKLLTKLFCERLKPDKKPSSAIIESALVYIDKHYWEDLSLDLVANQVFISKNYLSTLFKQSQGVGFTDYLNGVRVKKAQELLADPNNKVHTVSSLIGYSNYRYFNYLFRKATGMTPSEYRRSLTRQTS
jgi:two-component system response regulator YesN